jgi:NhaA family Na+:H+ antiporter
MKLYAPWEKQFQKVVTPFEEFLHAQTTTGIVLVIATIIALILANSPFKEAYFHFFHTPISITIGSFTLSHSLTHWINDALMAIFFFLVGLEIKREFLVGELSNLKVAILPIAAAIGGMIVPALIYLAINYNSIGVNGWGIPMATDIAFAISALVLLGKKVPKSLITFLVALAIVDDLGAVIVIAIFYTEEINLIFLTLAMATFLLMVLLNRFGISKLSPYFILSLFLWFFMLESGIHATIAGVLAALTIPSRPKKTKVSFVKSMELLLNDYKKASSHNIELNEQQKSLLNKMNETVNSVNTPAARLEHSLHLFVSLLIIPLFALANAGIEIDISKFQELLLTPISLGIISGLVVGKVIGIFGASYLLIKLNIASIPKDSTLSQLFGVAFLGGIGFTMSIFVADLAFKYNQELILQAKVAILFASLLAGLCGYIWLRFIAKNN